jgi:hypothetical protein
MRVKSAFSKLNHLKQGKPQYSLHQETINSKIQALLQGF